MPEGPAGGPRPFAECDQGVHVQFNELAVGNEGFNDYESALDSIFIEIERWMEEDVGTRPSVQDSGHFFVAILGEISVSKEQLDSLENRINRAIDGTRAELEFIEVRCS